MEMKHGTAVGTNTTVRVPVGFFPDLIIVMNITSAYMWFWMKSMANDTDVEMDPTDLVLGAADGITPYLEKYTAVATQTVKDIGFILGTTGQTTSDALLWIAFRE
jgi:hypothetical protein